MKSRTSLSVHNHRTPAAHTDSQAESESFVAQQTALYKNEIGDAITELLHEASQRGFTRHLWLLDDRFLARVDALCTIVSTRATVYYGISKTANRMLLHELERYVKQLASGLDVLAAQFSEETLTRRSPTRYHRSIAFALDNIQAAEKKLLEK